MKTQTLKTRVSFAAIVIALVILALTAVFVAPRKALFAEESVSQLQTVTITSADGDVADEDTYIVANNRAHYDELKAADEDLKVTYEVKISYNYRGIVIDSETRLYGLGYQVVKSADGEWANADPEIEEIGTAIAKKYSTRWFNSHDTVLESDIVNINNIDALINGAEGDEIVLYAFDNPGKIFLARADIVYDGMGHGFDQLNPFLAVSSDKIEEGMSVNLDGYTDPDGVAADDLTDITVVHDAGTYEFTVTADGNNYPLVIKVAQKVVNLGDYTNVLSWRLTEVDGVSTDSELRNRDGIQLYIYTNPTSGKKYPTRTALSQSELNALGLDSEYTQRTVRYSVVRKRANKMINGIEEPTDVSIGIAGGLADEAFEVVECTGNEGSDIGVYNATAQIRANKNYKLGVTSVTESGTRGISIQLGSDGKTATVTKVWYIVDIGNYLVFGASSDNSGSEYIIADRSYGDSNAVAVPRLMYGDVDESLYGDVEDPVSLTLYRNNVRIGSSTFTRNEFYDYITDSMPAGDYRLEVRIAAVNSVVYDESDTEMQNPQTLYHSACDETVEFTVNKVALSDSLVGELYSALNGSTFYHEWTGRANFYDAQTSVVAERVFASSANPSRTNTIWERYPELYGNFTIVYNLARMQSDEYLTPVYMDVAPTDPDRYTVYYKISAPNYYDTLETLGAGETRSDYSFYVVNVKTVNIPTVADKVYNGNVQTAELGDTVEYTVFVNDGGTKAGEYSVTLKFRNPDYYMWAGQTIDERTAQTVITYNITKATNRWETLPDIARWSEGEYSASDNTIIGRALFGTVVIVITDADDKVVYNSKTGLNDLASLDAGSYRLSATVEGNADYEGLTYATFFKVFEKPGLPWWAILLIVLGAIAIVALIIFIMYKKGVFQLMTGKLVIAIRTKATIDATIASVRASRLAEEARASRAEAEAQDRAEERAAARKRAAAASRAKSTEEKAEALENRAKAATERAQRILARAQAMQAQADAMKERALDDKAESIKVEVANQSEVDQFDATENTDVKPIDVTTTEPEVTTVVDAEVNTEQATEPETVTTEPETAAEQEPVTEPEVQAEGEQAQDEPAAEKAPKAAAPKKTTAKKPAAKKPAAKKSAQKDAE